MIKTSCSRSVSSTTSTIRISDDVPSRNHMQLEPRVLQKRGKNIGAVRSGRLHAFRTGKAFCRYSMSGRDSTLAEQSFTTIRSRSGQNGTLSAKNTLPNNIDVSHHESSSNARRNIQHEKAALDRHRRWPQYCTNHAQLHLQNPQ